METLGGYGSSSDDSDGEQPQTKVGNRFKIFLQILF